MSKPCQPFGISCEVTILVSAAGLMLAATTKSTGK